MNKVSLPKAIKRLIQFLNIMECYSSYDHGEITSVYTHENIPHSYAIQLKELSSVKYSLLCRHSSSFQDCNFKYSLEMNLTADDLTKKGMFCLIDHIANFIRCTSECTVDRLDVSEKFKEDFANFVD